MDIPENNHKKIIMAVALVVILILVLSAIVWKSKTKKAAQTQKATGSVGSPSETPTPPEIPKIQAPSEVASISGTVEKIEGKTITVKAFFFGEQKTYTVTVGDATKIQKSEMKKEISKPEEGKPVEPFTLTDASFSDIRQNDSLSIEASENIKDKTSFVAKTISINILNIPDASTLPKVENLPAPPDAPTPPKIENLPAPPAMPTPPSIPNIPKP
jgi:hypothetical protein